ncbi:hypothetical protein NEMBOFW57_003253 [Staphylotrichum longicolle]|uniref:U6 snRNA phosphodiesterase n=1 Tax=Staphylotrichum longicolle TaxID=669026 RepID=A0AAD4I2H8_9PEZI|nr:hypothetical protein NEMBOFW57_003253 [Staphylotrichum longicolle]
MPLVDYASDSDVSEPGTDSLDSPPKKKPRTASPPRTLDFGLGGTGVGARAGAGSGRGKPQPTSSALPPLPASFHDLYASTVRTTTRDDPALHQGRTRQNPHVPGNWPSHIYIEWHPPAAVHALLADLLASLQAEAAEEEITSLLQSDLAAPQPLHISLSRPLALPSEAKDAFLRDVARATRESGVAAFALACTRAEWHRTAESGRSFLVLRVESSSSSSNGGVAAAVKNAELTELLRRCNAVAAEYAQPGLYQWASTTATSAAEEEEGEDGNGGGGGGGRRRRNGVGEAFHVSIAWSFAELTEGLLQATERVFGGREVAARIREVRVPVDGVKVKIGNVVTHIALREPGKRTAGKGHRNLLGL